MRYFVHAEEDEAQRSSPLSKMLEKKEIKRGGRDGNTYGSNRFESGIKGFENERLKWRTNALVWRKNEQS